MLDHLKKNPIALFSSVLGCSLVLNLLVSLIVPLGFFDFWTQFFLGMMVAGTGGALGWWALLALQTGGVPATLSVDPPGLVMNGPYAISRNPLYIALAIIYLGIAILFDSPIAMLALIGLMVYVAKFMIPAEEAKLLRLFGASYETYRNRVGRWM